MSGNNYQDIVPGISTNRISNHEDHHTTWGRIGRMMCILTIAGMLMSLILSSFLIVYSNIHHNKTLGDKGETSVQSVFRNDTAGRIVLDNEISLIFSILFTVVLVILIVAMCVRKNEPDEITEGSTCKDCPRVFQDTMFSWHSNRFHRISSYEPISDASPVNTRDSVGTMETNHVKSNRLFVIVIFFFSAMFAIVVVSIVFYSIYSIYPMDHVTNTTSVSIGV